MKRKITCGGKPMTAIVLAGGRGLRMKADKTGLAIGGRTLLEHVLGQIEPYFNEVLLSVSPKQRTGRRPGPESRAGSGKNGRVPNVPAAVKVVEDETPGLGPLGGILAGLKAAKNAACAVIACDIPDIDVPLLRSLARVAREADIAVPVGPRGLYEPLFAVYRRSIVPEIEALILSGERSILPLFDRCRSAAVRLDDTTWLRNLNTRDDYEAYLRTLANRPSPADKGLGGKGRRGKDIPGRKT